MLPGVSTRGFEFMLPMPPPSGPYPAPPFASAPWQATHLALYSSRPWETEPLPAGKPWPSGVRTSMFHAARSASLTAWPKRGRSGSACTACGPVLPSGMPSAVLEAMPGPDGPCLAEQLQRSALPKASRVLNLADDIAHLPAGVDAPRLDAVVVLDEADDRARLAQVGDARLDVAVRVERAAHQGRGRAVPVPGGLEAREALVHHRLLELRLAPGLAAVGRDVDRADLAGARPGEPGDLVEARTLELHAARRIGDHRLGFHHHAELAPLAVRHRVGVARRLAAEVPGRFAELDAPQPLHADVAFPARQQRAHRVAVLRPQRLAVHRVDDERVVEHFLHRHRARVRGGVGALEERPPGFRIDARFFEQ